MDSDFSNLIEFRISDDDMHAYLTLDSPSNDPDVTVTPNIDDICEYIEMMGVTKGLRKYIIEEMIKNKKYNKETCVAEGLPPIDGKDGYYDFKINLNPSKQPKILPNGSVDFLNLDLIPSVGKGELIAEYIPKSEGASGYDIKGNNIPAKLGKELPPLIGTGFEVSEGGILYTASRDGKVELVGNRLTVTDLYTIRGDVDFSTGNINYHGDLEINGSIRSGMSVRVTGSLNVHGTIEAANVEVTKDILIKGGIIGSGRAYVNAGGSIIVKFIENAHVIAEDTVHSGAILSSYVLANKKIVVEGKLGNVVGGKLKATNLIEVTNIGSLSESKTEIEVGIDRFVYERQAYLVNESNRVKEEVEKIEQVINLLDGKSTNNNSEAIRHKLIKTKLDKLALMTRNKQEIDEIVERINMSQDAKIEVSNYIYPGVLICIDSYHLPITGVYRNVMFLRRGEQIFTVKAQQK